MLQAGKEPLIRRVGDQGVAYHLQERGLPAYDGYGGKVSGTIAVDL